MTTLTMGIDLASQPEKTAVCLLQWDTGRDPTLVLLRRASVEGGTALHSKWLSTTAYGIRGDYDGPITKVGIDAPFGWPEPFLDAVAAYRATGRWPVDIDEALGELRLRETDRAVHRRTGKTPLSVTSDRIALPAMRCASILTKIGENRGAEAVAKDGSGLCCEVYPDPAIRYWTEHAARPLGARETYKGKDASRKRVALLQAIQAELPIHDQEGRLDQIALEDDYMDALACALVARAAEVGATHLPETGEERGRATVEGWIHLPSEPLTLLSS
jgi:Protein of unknown function (DUF429)